MIVMTRTTMTITKLVRMQGEEEDTVSDDEDVEKGDKGIEGLRRRDIL